MEGRSEGEGRKRRRDTEGRWSVRGGDGECDRGRRSVIGGVGESVRGGDGV